MSDKIWQGSEQELTAYSYCTVNEHLNHESIYFSIEGEYVPVEGDEVTYKVSRIPPKNLKIQAVEVKIVHLNPGTKHETWSGQIISQLDES